MNEMSLPLAVTIGLSRVNRNGITFNPSWGLLVTDLKLSPDLSGAIALAPENREDNSFRGYDLVKFATPATPAPETTADTLWACAKEHYGLTAATAIAGIGGIPINKLRLGYTIHPKSSKYTNLVSHFGTKFFPMAKLPSGSIATRVAKNTFGTIRIFGIIGRAMPFVAVGLAVFDAVSIGMCAYEERNRK